jgi:hypothetical protein
MFNPDWRAQFQRLKLTFHEPLSNFSFNVNLRLYSLVDDLTGNGKMDVVLATMNGNVYAFESMDTPYDPMNAWTSQVHSVNNVGLGCSPRHLTRFEPLDINLSGII